VKGTRELALNSSRKVPTMPSKPRGSRPPDPLARVAGGAVTLVLGAGVSMPRCVPSWLDLAADLWKGTLGPCPPWLTTARDDWQQLQRCRELLAGQVPPAFLERLNASPAPPHPLALPIVFEEVQAELSRQRRQRLRSEADDLDDTFAGELRDAMYRFERPARGDTLATLAEVIRREQRSARRRLVRVITFNADDLLEREVHKGLDPESDAPIAWIIARASHTPSSGAGLHDLPPVPVYHVHGFLPREPEERWWIDAPDTLVFTEAQYWQSVASPLSFANRVMAAALHDSHCLFIGMSMTDINVMRWLGVRSGEIVADRDAQRRAAPGKAEASAEYLEHLALAQHLWIRTASADPTGLVSKHLRRRGVRSVELSAWGAPFRRCMKVCFPLERS